ncbi:MAG: FAD-dependent oxidoreductase [Deltaproteobacteria bacterium]|nr:FAD-dependent oxidoreductase [Deltaproteobacteria bacterium]
MRDPSDVVVDVAIFGGGIAGLWLLDRLQREGFSAALFEAEQLGAGQSVASQGIIHGGAKYTLGLLRDSAVDELREMPPIWRSALSASKGPDLSSARTLSTRTFMWVPKQVGSNLLGAFSKIVMRSRVSSLSRSDWPAGLNSPSAKGSVYALDELVLDVPSVLEALKAGHASRIRRIPAGEVAHFESGHARFRIAGTGIRAQRVVLTAGAGNQALLARAGIKEVRQQLRPLHQVLVAGMKEPLYAHCVGRSSRPLATVTAHPSAGGDHVWNVGGSIAEEGVGQSERALIARARRDLPRLFPAADFGRARWSTFRVNRAEGAEAGGSRPAGPLVESRGSFIVAWPTKLALAPALAERVVRLLNAQQVRPADSRIDSLARLDEPEIARPPWERPMAWS